MKLLTGMISILLALTVGCSKSTSDQNFQDHQSREPAHYDSKLDPNINSLSNQTTREGL